MLKFSSVKKYYDKKLIVAINNLEMPHGIFWLKGTNGSGKTTLLKMIAGLLPFEGDIYWNTISLKSSPVAYRQNISWAEAEPLYPYFLTGMDLLLLYQGIRRASKKDANMLVERFSMTSYVNDKIETYSTGMLKKLSLALAFLGNQQLIVLDEALITLDPDGLSALCSLILDSYKKNNTTFILSSHQGLDSRLLVHSQELTIANQTVS